MTNIHHVNLKVRLAVDLDELARSRREDGWGDKSDGDPIEDVRGWVEYVLGQGGLPAGIVYAEATLDR